MIKLKRCPFCGNDVELEKIPLWHGSHGYHGCYEYEIKCSKCGCTLRYEKNDTIYRSDDVAKNNVIEAWNRRAKDYEPRLGKWRVTNKFEDCCYAKCNQCNVTQVFYRNKPLTNFCPNCGAKMEGVSDE